MYTFTSKLIKTDVTSIKLISDYVFIGIGSSLFVYQRESFDLVYQIKVFNGQRIHGTILNDQGTKLLVFGENKMSIFLCQFVPFKLELNHNLHVNDWILNAKWLINDRIAAVHMNNNILLYSEDLKELKKLSCKERCILYSALICYNTWEELVVLCGTVFSEILIWKPSQSDNQNCEVIKRLKGHQGVIFSLDYNYKNGYICSCSDDRSTILWPLNLAHLKQINASNTEPQCRVYGHLSRIFRCKIMDNCFITAGEDSLINIWSFEGALLRKIEAHQGGCIWAFDCDNKSLFSGAGDGSVTATPLNQSLKEYKLNIPDKEIPKKFGLLGDNVIVISENGILYYYISKIETWRKIFEYKDLTNYVLMEISDCRQLVALAGFQGQIYLYKDGEDSLDLIHMHQLEDRSRIFAFHWLSCESFLTCESEGRLTLWSFLEDKCILIASFNLPPMKENCTTAAYKIENNCIIGDRKGNIYIYGIGSSEPIQIVRKAHNHLGITKIYNIKNQILSLGRNSIVKTFNFNSTNTALIEYLADKVPFSWLVSLENDTLLAFTGDQFVVWDYRNRRTLLEINCGGGHRCWDFVKFNNHTIFGYIKNKVINLIRCPINDITSVNLQSDYHVNEINCVELINIGSNYLVISGGEDTTVRVAILYKNNLYNVYNLKSHLSSIRTICKYELEAASGRQEFLIFTGGGRGQIICWKLSISYDFPKCLFSEEDSYYQQAIDNESEVRIMDLKTIRVDNRPVLFAATSDGNVNIFTINKEDKYKIHFKQKLHYKLRCIMKICLIEVAKTTLLISMATDGQIVFWDVSNILQKTEPLCSFSVHQSGINSYCFQVINDSIVFVTGGDDNAIIENYFVIKTSNGEVKEVKRSCRFIDVGAHCAQITGVYLTDNLLFTTSVDQKLLIFNREFREMTWKCVARYNTAIADVQGFQCCKRKNYFTILLYGKGVEYLKIQTSDFI